MHSSEQEEMLQVGTLHCPTDNEPLHFEVFGMMRIRRKASEHTWKYQARCPKCKAYWDVQAPREKNT